VREIIGPVVILCAVVDVSVGVMRIRALSRSTGAFMANRSLTGLRVRNCATFIPDIEYMASRVFPDQNSMLRLP
jgi:hypothetical protein